MSKSISEVSMVETVERFFVMNENQIEGILIFVDLFEYDTECHYVIYARSTTSKTCLLPSNSQSHSINHRQKSLLLGILLKICQHQEVSTI